MRQLVLWVCLGLALTSCVAPVNLTFESARTLPKGKVDLQGNLGGYFFPNRYGFTNLNYGGKVGYGFTDNHTIKFRYEHMVAPDILRGWQDYFHSDPIQVEMDYFELENKIRFKNKHALGLTFGYYSHGLFSFDPRYYMTFPVKENTVEFSFIPKFHLLMGGRNAVFIPGFSFGFGISSDLDRWAFRPEAGWDGFFSAGGALTYRFGKE